MEYVFWASVLGLLWCTLGYPVCMMVYARLRPRPWRAEETPSPGRVSVVLAVRNGAEHLERRLDNLLQQDHPTDRFEILVVCNGCVDRSREVAEAVARRDPRVRVLSSAAEGGKAGALNQGAAHATGEFLVFADVRQTFEHDAVRNLLKPFGDPEVGAVSGRLLVGRAERAAVEGIRLYWSAETLLRMAESRTGSVVGVTGAIYAVRRECYEPIPPGTILDDVWLPMRIIEEGRRVVLAPDAVAFDVPASSQRMEYLRKRRTTVGNLQLLRQLRWLLHPTQNPVFVRYISHKLLRVMAPVFLVAIVASAALLQGWLYSAVFWAGVTMYALGMAGLVFPLRWLSVASAAVLIHAAVFSAFLRYRDDAAGVWRPAHTPATHL